MAKFEITLTCETWTDKSNEPDEEPLKAALLRIPLVDIEVDLDEVDHTITDTKWEITVTGEFECANGEEEPIAKQAGDVLTAAGFAHVSWDMDEEDYPMPEHEVLEVFRDTILPNLPDNRIAKWEAYQFHIDSLNKRGMITDWQAEHIPNPWSKS